MQPAPANNIAELANTALTAVQTISSVAQTTLTALALLLGILSVIGFVVIYKGCVAAATKRADAKLKEYMDTPEFIKLLNEKVAKGIDEKLRSTIVVNLHPESRASTDESGFRDPPRGGNDSR